MIVHNLESKNTESGIYLQSGLGIGQLGQVLSTWQTREEG
jgi:hypothetical protein